MGYVFARLMRTRARFAIIAAAITIPLLFAVGYYSAGGIPTDGGEGDWNPFGSVLLGAVLLFCLVAGFLVTFAWVATTALRILEEGQEERRR